MEDEVEIEAGGEGPSGGEAANRPAAPDAPWYAAGLRFECQRTGNCCTGDPGTVRLAPAEIEALARRLGLERPAFEVIYTRRLPSGMVSLRERPNGDCVLYAAAAGCQVYPERPRQCRTWPFWRSNLQSRAHWERAARACPGMNRGPFVAAERIRRTSEDDGTAGERAAEGTPL
ncbi:MAG: YkgJ family cysteine cluster protein [Planctomycetota bacterium]